MKAQARQARHKTLLNIAILLVIAAGVLALWAWFNRPMDVPPWPSRIAGYSFSPFQPGQNPADKIFPSPDDIRADLALVGQHTKRVRTYSVEDVLGDIPALAAEQGFFVTLGIWIDADLERNETEIARAIDIINRSRNIEYVVVGNETLYRENVSIEQLAHYIETVRAAVKVPVTTAEPWHVWIAHPELARHVDLIGAHVLPYWENIHADNAVDFVLQRALDLQAAFPTKPLLLAEVGWPSRGRTRGQAEATQAEQAVYLRRLVNALNQEGYTYFVIEAFDQVWKTRNEGAVGAYWGVFDAERRLKFPLTGPVVEIPQWRILAIISVVLAAFAMGLLLIDSSGLRQRGRTFLATVAFAGMSLLVTIGYDYSQQYITWATGLMGILLTLGALGIFLVLFTEAHELAEVVWMRERRRPFHAVTVDAAYRPKVSVHVPCYNEPPEMVVATLNALAALDYPDFEVLVIDNNTRDPAVWQPVEAYCGTLGPRFRFFHVAPLAGFKAGALNYALERTAADAEVVAVIDSDYIVRADWLKHLVPHFADPSIAVVQAPQDYRDDRESLFKRLCDDEYKGFFHIGMVTRNDRDAIIQHGTMTMVRRTVLDRVRWAEWCITEDAELGLRIFELGLSAAYISDSYGQGLMPDTFIDYKKQRFRWAYGSMQIMKRHVGSLFFARNTRLTRGQRYHFLAGWLPWVADGLNIFYTVGALFWAAAMIIAPTRIDPPLMIFALPPIALFFFKLGKILFLYQRAVGVSLGQAASAAIAGLSLSHTIGKAVVYGLVTKSIPFFRTPKLRSEHGLLRAFAETREEFFFLVLLWLAAAGVLWVQSVQSLDVMVWSAVLVVQSLPYLAALVMALLSAMPSRDAASEVAVPPAA